MLGESSGQEEGQVAKESSAVNKRKEEPHEEEPGNKEGATRKELRPHEKEKEAEEVTRGKEPLEGSELEESWSS